ncbi:hypothetical protein BJ742DRAFT_252048 [Cladochytrium replicatum]|nr:hypothetical protein BJ742DRAFT_252048 [Cladochytrium replicatum]
MLRIDNPHPSPNQIPNTLKGCCLRFVVGAMLSPVSILQPCVLSAAQTKSSRETHSNSVNRYPDSFRLASASVLIRTSCNFEWSLPGGFEFIVAISQKTFIVATTVHQITCAPNCVELEHWKIARKKIVTAPLDPQNLVPLIRKILESADVNTLTSKEGSSYGTGGGSRRLVRTQTGVV